MRFPARSNAAVLSLSLAIAGCNADGNTNGDNPGVITPNRATPGSAKMPPSASNDRVLAQIETVTVSQSELVPLLYEAYGLDGMLKLLQRNMARAAAARMNLTVSAVDIAAEQKLTLQLAFAGQVEGDVDYDRLLKQLLSQERVSRVEFDVVMDTNAHLRACVRGRAGTDVTQEAIRNEYNLLYGEKVRIRAIPLSNMQEVADVQRQLAEPGARFEVIARRTGKIPALAQLGGQLPEFARTSSGFSQVFIETAFTLQPGQVSDAIKEGDYYYLLKLEERIAPKVVKFDDVRDAVREQLIVRRTNDLMARMRQEFAQRALRDLAITEPTMKRQFEERKAAANPKPADRGEVQRSLEQPPATQPHATTATAPTTAPSR